jgi:hypothetical protein
MAASAPALHAGTPAGATPHSRPAQFVYVAAHSPRRVLSSALLFFSLRTLLEHRCVAEPSASYTDNVVLWWD